MVEIRIYMSLETEMIRASLKSTHQDELPLNVSQVELATLVQRGSELWSHPSPLLMPSIYGLMLVPLLSYADIELPHASNPPLWILLPWSCMDVLNDIHGRMHSFPLIHLEESCLPSAEWVLGNLLIVVIPHSHSLPEFVHIGWSW